MKQYLLYAVVACCSVWAASAAHAECGEPVKLAGFYHRAVVVKEPGARGKLVAAMFPVTECLTREGRLVAPVGLKGRYFPVFQTLSALTGVRLTLRSVQDIDDQIRAWKIMGRR